MKSGTKTIVVKVGTSSLTYDNGIFCEDKLADIVRQVSFLKKQGHNVVVVSSGSIAAGFQAIGYNQRPVAVQEKQAAAAVGQGLLIEKYTQHFEKYGYTAAQILITRADFVDRRRFHNAFSTLNELIRVGAVPVINENDTTSIAELKFGDNDTLSAMVASMIHADLLVLATDVAGLYDTDPRKDKNAKRIDYVAKVTDSIRGSAGEAASALSCGGMSSKIRAAEIASVSGVPMFICSYKDEDSIIRSADCSGNGTYFAASDSLLKTKLQWISFCSVVKGRLYIDPGATDALINHGKSLLASGVLACDGSFIENDIVDVYDYNQNFIGRGIIDYDSDTLSRIKGRHSSCAKRKAVIHRDRWVYAEKILNFSEDEDVL